MNVIKEFFIFNLTCCKFVALKANTLTHSFQNHCSKQINLIGFKSLNTKQCPAGLPLRIIYLNLYGKHWRWGRIPANSQKYTNIPEKLFLINLHLPLSKVSFLLHQIAIYISSPYTSFICSCSHCCCITFLTSGFICMYMSC